MSTETTIEWTDVTWNPVTGCDKVSPGCAHCYAEVNAGRLWPSQYPLHFVKGGKSTGLYRGDPLTSTDEFRVREFTDVRTHEDRLDQPLRWKRPRKVFVNSMSDLFYGDDEDRRRCERDGRPFNPVPFEFIDRVFAVMAMAEQHTFQVLTKRPARMLGYITNRLHALDIYGQFQKLPGYERVVWRGIPLPNVWLGVSVENQHFADERIPLLLQTPAAVRFISAEPLLGPISFAAPRWNPQTRDYDTVMFPPELDWVIVGGESGRKARPLEVSWVRAIVRQCEASGVAVFVKQLGAKPFDGYLSAKELVEGAAGRPRPADQPLTEEGAKAILGPFADRPHHRWLPIRSPKGGDMAEWPENLRVREMPGGKAGPVRASPGLSASTGPSNGPV